MSILDRSNRFYNTGNVTHLCVILPELTGLNTSVEPKTVLAIIYTKFVWYIILIAKKSKVWEIVWEPNDISTMSQTNCVVWYVVVGGGHVKDKDQRAGA